MTKMIKIVTAVIIGVLGFSMLVVTPTFADEETGGGESSGTQEAGEAGKSGDSSGAGGEGPNVDACKNLTSQVARDALGCDNAGASDKLPKIIQGILNAIIGVAGTVAVVFIVVGGISYMTSTGEPAKIKKAKDTILYACIGLAVCALAFIIVNWTIGIISSSSGSGGSGQSESSEGDSGEGGGS